MIKRQILHRTIRQFYQPFLAEFDQLSEQDVEMILASTPELFLSLFHIRYGYTQAETIRAWNQFVLRYVDGGAQSRR